MLFLPLFRTPTVPCYYIGFTVLPNSHSFLTIVFAFCSAGWVVCHRETARRDGCWRLPNYMPSCCPSATHHLFCNQKNATSAVRIAVILFRCVRFARKAFCNRPAYALRVCVPCKRLPDYRTPSPVLGTSCGGSFVALACELFAYLLPRSTVPRSYIACIAKRLRLTFITGLVAILFSLPLPFVARLSSGPGHSIACLCPDFTVLHTYLLGHLPTHTSLLLVHSVLGPACSSMATSCYVLLHLLACTWAGCAAFALIISCYRPHLCLHRIPLQRFVRSHH